MKTFLKLCLSIIKKNKGFTAGIFIMSVLSAAIAFLGVNFGQSSNETIMGFISDSGMPDAVFTTAMLPEDMEDILEAVEGVSLASPRFIYDTNMTAEDGSLYSVRLIAWDPASPFKHTVHEKTADTSDGPEAFISSEFAEYNDVHPGDEVIFHTAFGKRQATIRAVIANPETMNPVKDDLSAYESYRFAYVYIPKKDINDILPDHTSANQWLIYFDQGLSAKEERACMDKLREELGESYVTGIYTEESEAVNSIRDDLKTISVLCAFIPGIIWLLSLGFTFIFIRIIIENQKKTIGLLRALGFSVKRVVQIFIAYTLMINIPALFLGIPAGYGLLKLCLNALASAEGILRPAVSVKPVLTGLMMLVVLIIGAGAALLSARTISKVDPSAAYGGYTVQDFEPPKFIARIRTGSFFKLSLVSLFRNFRRQLIGALCIAACVVAMCVGFEGVRSIGHPIDAVFGGRLRYDLAVRSIDKEAIEAIRAEVSGIERIETVSFFSADAYGGSVRISTLADTDELVTVKDADGQRLYPGDGVLIDEMYAKIHGIDVGDHVFVEGQDLPVTGIAREILYNVWYISPETAENLKHGAVNGAYIKLENGVDIGAVEKDISGIANEAYFAEFASQKANIRDGFAAMRLIMLIFAVLAFGIGSLLILNMTVIDFNDNKMRYATLRALGTPVKRFTVVAAVENISRVLAGIFIALPLSYAAVSVLLKLLSGASQQYVMVDYAKCLMLSCLFPVLYVFFGTGVSLIKIRNMDFLSYLNEVE